MGRCTRPAAKEDERQTWNPITKPSIAAFQHDLLIIGPVHVLEGDILRQENAIERDFSDGSSKIVCLTGFHPKNQFVVGQSVDGYLMSVMFEKNKDKKSWIISESEGNVEDFEDSRETWKSLVDDPTVLSMPKRNSLIVHRHCFELIQSICIKQGNGTLTFRGFWNAAMKYKDKFLFAIGLDPVYREKEPWFQYGDINGINALSLKQQVDKDSLGIRFRRAIGISYMTGTIDRHLRTEVWEAMKVERFFPLDGFPLDDAFLESEIVQRLQRTKISSDPAFCSMDFFSKLPTEILGEVISYINTKTALNLALTCKSLSNSVLSMMDKAALFEILTQHSWMLPMTPREKMKWKQIINDRHDGKAVPWHCYMRVCLDPHSWSIKNRRRVWVNANSIYNDILERKLLE